MIIRLADRNIEVKPLHPYLMEYCKEYLLSDGDHSTLIDFKVIIDPKDIEYEREKSRIEFFSKGEDYYDFSDEYLETLAVYRKIADIMPKYDTFLIHGSAISVDGFGYLFTAPSGTGKSTHTALWRKAFGERADMINDDKPLIRIDPTGKAIIYGTPWDGKHRLSKNISVPLKSICILERDAQNSIRQIDSKDAFPELLRQIYRPRDPQNLIKTMTIVEKLVKVVQLYRLYCNMESDAATMAYAYMNK